MIVQPPPLVNILIVLGEGFWVVSAFLQLRKLIRTRDTRGLSAITQTLNAAGNIAWCTYFAMHQLWYPFITNVLVISLAILIIGFIISDRKRFVQGILAILIIGSITSYILIHFPGQSGWSGMIYNWIAATPWLVKVIHTKKVSGISGKGLLFAIGAMILTMAYALIIASLPLIAGCVQGLIYEGIIATFFYRFKSKKT